MTGFETYVEGIVHIAVVRDLPVYRPSIVSTSEDLLEHVEILHLDEVRDRHSEQDSHAGLVLGSVLAACQHENLVGLVGGAVRHRQQQHDRAIASERVDAEALLCIEGKSEFPVRQY